jgi:hypothetical protein
VETTCFATKRILSFVEKNWHFKMDLNKRPQRKKNLPVRLQDPNENITSVSKRPAKSKKMEIDSSKETEVDLSQEMEVPSYHLNKQPQRKKPLL